jgi:hypothetical protein
MCARFGFSGQFATQAAFAGAYQGSGGVIPHSYSLPDE